MGRIGFTDIDSVEREEFDSKDVYKDWNALIVFLAAFKHLNLSEKGGTFTLYLCQHMTSAKKALLIKYGRRRMMFNFEQVEALEGMFQEHLLKPGAPDTTSVVLGMLKSAREGLENDIMSGVTKH